MFSRLVIVESKPVTNEIYLHFNSELFVRQHYYVQYFFLEVIFRAANK